MRNIIVKTLALGTAMAAGSVAVAQTPPAQPSAGGTPDKMPFDIPYGTDISAATAQKLLEAAESEAAKHSWKENIAVVDTHGDLVAFVRMDGAQLGSIPIAQGKARTATRFRRDTRAFFNAIQTGNPYISTLDPTLIASPGGFPLVEDGKIIGAIGCSGATGDQDAEICKVGADMVK
jgi:glc operon protein GlcG